MTLAVPVAVAAANVFDLLPLMPFIAACRFVFSLVSVVVVSSHRLKETHLGIKFFYRNEKLKSYAKKSINHGGGGGNRV